MQKTVEGESHVLQEGAGVAAGKVLGAFTARGMRGTLHAPWTPRNYGPMAEQRCAQFCLPCANVL